jgi:hypothetical protein
MASRIVPGVLVYFEVSFLAMASAAGASSLWRVISKDPRPERTASWSTIEPNGSESVKVAQVQKQNMMSPRR